MILPVGKPDAFEGLPRQPQRLRPVHPGDERLHGHIFLGGKLGQQVVELEDEPKLFVAEMGFFHGRHVRQAFALEQYLARGRRVQRAEQVEEGGFARSRRSDDGEGFASTDGQVHIFQNGDALRRSLAGLLDAGKLVEHRGRGRVRCLFHHSNRRASAGSRLEACRAG